MTEGFTFKAAYQFGTSVKIDGDMVGVVTGIAAYSDKDIEYRVEWIHNGTPQATWFKTYRLVEAE